MSVLLPGSTIGMLGGGQLGRMSILAGRRMGYRFIVLEPKAGSSAGMVADGQIVAAYDDDEALRELSRQVDRVTLEFENIPAHVHRVLEERVSVYPGDKALSVAQNREREKTFLKENHFPCAPFKVVESLLELKKAVAEVGTPCVLKTADFGYDGKGQVKIDKDSDLDLIWKLFEGNKAVLEKWIQFQGEYSVICVRNVSGEEAVYPLFKNTHKNHILHTTQCPSGLSVDLEAEAQGLGLALARKLNYVGVLAVELFLVNESWIVNEIAPRPHNSGHLTFDATVTSQFEQHIRAVCNLPLGSTKLLRPACMLNLLGDLWQKGEPDWEKVLQNNRVKLHLYDKGAPKAGRKMGHLTVLADRVEDATKQAKELDLVLQFVSK